MVRIVSHLRPGSGKPAETVVLLPFAQLLDPAREVWSSLVGAGFTPRFETTRTWAARLAPFVAQGLDLSQQPARDLVVARQLMRTAGLDASVPATALLEAAAELSRMAGSVAPSERAGWCAQARVLLPLLPDAPHSVETAMARLALEWVSASRLPTDVLWHTLQAGHPERLFVLAGLQPDPLVQAWAARWPERVHTIDLLAALRGEAPGDAPWAPRRDRVVLHEAMDTEDEAQRAAACVLRHLAAGRQPVALATTDRVLSRRVQALLAERGVAVRDETGWRLSTTRAAATLMRTLELFSPDPSTDAVLDWLKSVTASMTAKGDGATGEAAVCALEIQARHWGASRWTAFAARLLQPDAHDPQPAAGLSRHAVPAEASQWVRRVQAWRSAGQGRHRLSEWMQRLRSVLQDCGLWSALLDDAAGRPLLGALGLDTVAGGAPLADLDDLPEAARALSWTRLSAWTRAVLEEASFKPSAPAKPEVFLLPLAQFTGRHCSAAVLPGCDEVHLPQSPALAGPWTRVQRKALGLPDAQNLRQTQALAWRDALATPWVDILWRRRDAMGHPVAASGFVQGLQLAGWCAGEDPRDIRCEPAAPVSAASACAPARVPQRLSATEYADLRACPYRFFALRMLSLRNADEIEMAVDKRDFGAWLHWVLHDFHEHLEPATSALSQIEALARQRALLDAAAERARAQLGLSQAEFLPFVAAWPDLRERYLAWWSAQRTQGVRFLEGEAVREAIVARRGGTVVLHGRIDRIDQVEPGGTATAATLRVIDYKTEHESRTRERVRDPMEDTQMAFYAALVSPPNAAPAQDAEILEGGYLQLGERSDPKWIGQPQLLAARDALLQGVVRDLDAIGAGAALEAIGTADACTHCQARGLCRKDHWQ